MAPSGEGIQVGCGGSIRTLFTARHGAEWEIQTRCQKRVHVHLTIRGERGRWITALSSEAPAERILRSRPPLGFESGGKIVPGNLHRWPLHQKPL